MKDAYYKVLEDKKKRWDASSFLLKNQIDDLRKIEQAAKGQWKQILNDHITFLAHFNNEAFDFIEESMRFHVHSRFQIEMLNETLQSYASHDIELFKNLIKKLRSDATN